MNAPPTFESAFHAKFGSRYSFEALLKLDAAQHVGSYVVDNRTIWDPRPPLREFLRFLNTFVFQRLTINKRVLFSYRKGVSIRDAVKRHANGVHFLTLDFANFFPSISEDLVQDALLYRSTNVGIADLVDYVPRILRLVLLNGAPPVGFATSPAIGNASLSAFDDRVELCCDQRRVVYTRYCDDLVFSASNRDSILAVEDLVRREISNLGLPGSFVLNEGKTKLLRSGRKIKLHGLVVTQDGRVTVDRSFKSKIEAMLHLRQTNEAAFVDFSKASALPAALEALSGRVNYVRSADPDYLEALRRKYGHATIESLIRRTAS